MKNLIKILAVGVFSISYGQVGINTDTPKQTLDIEGTLRIKETSLPTNQTANKPIAWIPSTGSDSNNGQIVEGEDIRNEKPFKILSYRFHLSKKSSDFINGADLGYSTTDYTILLMQYALKDDQGNPAYLRALNEVGDTYYPLFSRTQLQRGKLRRGKNVNYETGTYTKEDATGGKIVISSPIVMVYPKNKKWHFYADYPGVAPLSFKWADYNIRKVSNKNPVNINRTFIWEAKFLVIKNSQVTNEDITISTTGNYNHPILGKK